MKKLLTLVTTIMLLGFGLFNLAQAGQESHGGNVVKCDEKETVTLDYYNAALPTVGGPADIVYVAGWNEGEVVDFIRSRLSNSLFLELFDDAIEKFGPMNDWPLANLKDVNDGGEPYFLPPTCKRVTAAVRQANTIYVDPNVFAHLSPAQRGILYVHEILYFISNQSASTPVREMLRTFLKKNPSQAEIIKATQYVGPYYDYQFINGQVGFQIDQPGLTKQVLSIQGAFEKKELKSILISSPTGFGERIINSTFAWLDCRALTSCKMDLDLRIGVTSDSRICEVRFPSTKRMQLICKDLEIINLVRID